jgi:hypothetical protein
MGRWHVMRLAQVIAWAAIAVIAYFTLGPVYTYRIHRMMAARLTTA